MFRFLASRLLTPRQRPVARYHATPTLNMSAKQFTPGEWYIVEASPGGVDKELVNRVTGATTWGAPPGADAAGLLKIPGACKYWGSLREAERFIRESEAETAAEGRAAGTNGEGA